MKNNNKLTLKTLKSELELLKSSKGNNKARVDRGPLQTDIRNLNLEVDS